MSSLARLQDLSPGTHLSGLDPDGVAEVLSVTHHGDAAADVVYRLPSGRLTSRVVFAQDLGQLCPVDSSTSRFSGDGALFRLVAEAHRIRLAHLFDPFMAVRSSLVEPLPHQLTAVYRLRQRLSKAARHFLLLSATPHNGKEEDFQLFLTLLYPDRFEGRPRGKATPTDPTGAQLRPRHDAASNGWPSRPSCARNGRQGAPRDVGHLKRVYDVECLAPDGTVHFIGVKGRVAGADTVTLTRNEIITALNKQGRWTLALVEVPPGAPAAEAAEFGGAGYAAEPAASYTPVPLRYVTDVPFREPGFAEIASTLDWHTLWSRGQSPS